MKNEEVERHPLEPYIPQGGARVLMLGSFPPSRARWCMDFFYPNFQNDMWRIFGIIFCGDKDALVDHEHKSYRLSDIKALLDAEGVAIYDTADAVVRTKGTAADADLEIEHETDIAALLEQMPTCHTLVSTGGKSAEVCAKWAGVAMPRVGECADGVIAGRPVRLWRMPSSSRAYPLRVEKKAEMYARVFGRK